MKFPEQIEKRFYEGQSCWSEIGEGWIPLVVELDERLAKLYPDYKIDQIKEKFGMMSFYAHGILNDDGWKLITEYEDRTLYTCYHCGRLAKRVAINGWYMVLCEEHEAWFRLHRENPK